MGDVGITTAGNQGRAAFRIEDSSVKIWDVIGRSVVIHDAQSESSGQSLTSR